MLTYFSDLNDPNAPNPQLLVGQRRTKFRGTSTRLDTYQLHAARRRYNNVEGIDKRVWWRYRVVQDHAPSVAERVTFGYSVEVDAN